MIYVKNPQKKYIIKSIFMDNNRDKRISKIKLWFDGKKYYFDLGFFSSDCIDSNNLREIADYLDKLNKAQKSTTTSKKKSGHN